MVTPDHHNAKTTAADRNDSACRSDEQDEQDEAALAALGIQAVSQLAAPPSHFADGRDPQSPGVQARIHLVVVLQLRPEHLRPVPLHLDHFLLPLDRRRRSLRHLGMAARRSRRIVPRAVERRDCLRVPHRR